MKVYATGSNLAEVGKTPQVRLIKSNLTREVLEGKTIFETKSFDIANILNRYKLYAETFYKYPWLSGSLNAVAKTISGSGFSVVPTDSSVELSAADEKTALKIYDFIKSAYSKKRWQNVKDSMTVINKLHLTVLYYVLFGQASWEVVKDGRGAPSGFDFMFGLTVPNINGEGEYLSPAYNFYPLTDVFAPKPVEFDDSSDVVLFSSPSLFGDFVGKTYMESLFEYTIPGDIYAARSYLSLHKNHNRPAGMWQTHEMDDDDFDEFADQIENIYRGVDNYGASAIVVRGQVEFKEFRSAAKDDMPYHEGRRFALGEVAAVTGVPTAKLGVSEDMDKSDLQEMKREYYETTIRPIARTIEETIDEQVIRRFFGTTALRFKFEEPDFMKGLERSAVAKRFFDVGAVNPNEIRKMYLNLPPREGGEQYIEELRISSNVFLPQGKQAENLKGPGEDASTEEPGGSPRTRVAGSENQERQPGDVGASTATEMPRVEKMIINRDSYLEILKELQLWERFMIDTITGQRKKREFRFEKIPGVLAESMQKEYETLAPSDSTVEKKLQSLAIVSAVVREIIYEFFDVVESLDGRN